MRLQKVEFVYVINAAIEKKTLGFLSVTFLSIYRFGTLADHSVSEIRGSSFTADSIIVIHG